MICIVDKVHGIILAPKFDDALRADLFVAKQPIWFRWRLLVRDYS